MAPQGVPLRRGEVAAAPRDGGLVEAREGLEVFDAHVGHELDELGVGRERDARAVRRDPQEVLSPRFEVHVAAAGGLVAQGPRALEGLVGAQRVETVRAVCNHDMELLLNRYCARVYTGTAPTGAACRLTAECAGEARCQTFGSPCGVCLPRAVLGGACAGGYDSCARTATGWSECDVAGLSGSASGVCRAGRLVTGAAAGDACGVRRTAAGVIERVVCEAGAWCSAPRDGVGECRAHREVGASCAEGEVCEGDALCVTEGGSGTCRAQTIVDAEGGACGTSEGSPRCDPVTNLVCFRGVCQRPGDGSANAPCVWDTPVVSCGAGLTCIHDTMSTCQAPLADGAACHVNGECLSGWCDGAATEARRCVPTRC